MWTDEEVEYLENAWGTVSISGIAKKLNRSINAVKLKARRCGLRDHMHSGTSATLQQVIEALGKDGGTSYFTRRLIKAGCPIKKHKVVKSSFRVVDLDEFWIWAEKNKRIFDFSKFEENLLGIEPQWVKEKRKEDKMNLLRPHNCKWTIGDDNRLKNLLSAYRYTYSDLSKKMLRSESAIKRRINDLGLKQRPLREESRPWTSEETTALLTLWDKGYSYERIADVLKRTALQVRGKHERIKNPEMSKRAYRNFRDKTKREALL